MKRDLFFTHEGRMKMAFAAPIALIAFFASQYLAAAIFGALSAFALEQWGVTQKSLPYAPAWLQTAAASYPSIEALFSALFSFFAVSLCARFLRKRPIQLHFRHIPAGAGIGSCLSVAAFVLLYATDSVRTMACTPPGFWAEAFAFLGTAASVLATEALVGGFFFREADSAGLFGRASLRIALFALLNALTYVLSAYWTLPALLSTAAMSVACAALYDRRSFLSAAALRCFWSFIAHRVLGFSASGMFFETYPVSQDWLTGGDLGLESGWLCAILFSAAAVLILRFFRKSAENRRQ